ncbi:DNA translocase FtsK [Weeksellaceae bacterium KMM 9724]|uniref:FtsK/SpoIIIE family DNA translocase n=1 Tax=Profundicola chukchiensis TaxID=2961959 RepID=UPI00243B8E78|nr:DNA translocase FtsK [Profundicola chukchiensis]MDG4951468.1 DNA translocase FtsK [Profundicola chukchiensis]
MAKKTKDTPQPKITINWAMVRMVTGIIFVFTGVVMFLSFISHLINWKEDQSQIGTWNDETFEVNNIFGKLGAWLGDMFIYKGLGASAILISLWLVLVGVLIIFKLKKFKILTTTLNMLFFLIWMPLFFSFTFPEHDNFGGRMGFVLKKYLMDLVDSLGIILILAFSFLLFAVLEWRITPEKIANKIKEDRLAKDLRREKKEAKKQELKKEKESAKKELIEEDSQEEIAAETPIPAATPKKAFDTTTSDDELEPFKVSASSQKKEKPKSSPTSQPKEEKKQEVVFEPEIKEIIIEPHKEGDVALTVETTKEEAVTDGSVSNQLVEKFGEFDPTLELSKYKFPTLDLLREYEGGNDVSIDQVELESNKDKIVDTLGNYGINIDSIKATIGPTVTLYEIVPEAGVRISKIKNLEDDIALSLSALGIRIIAPIPGKGTIGIEVPNSNPTMVSMRSVISSQKFQTSKMELPIAFGKTISNETLVVDLAKMPHMLMAGATGQGKSVGLNAIITSLLYKKHPAELKFVMVDPKKVELALYNKIERHFLAKLPDSEDAIITDNQKVIHTLNSLCIEMDDRYDLLKDAYVRNIKEYNEKFKARKLSPENGHRFMPYIVLVVDEFADLIMTAGKEVEQPIARLAQLARAVGIHLIIATQRPSVNVITGIIKANFPARVAFRVTSKVDSRTILDSGGADQLIGKGDMLYTTGNDLVRIQCAFVDTPEVDEIADYIGSQKGYPDAYMLPEYEGEDGGSGDPLDVDPNDRDSLFNDAARIVVASQSGSASLLQRKLKIGYNRAGRIIDQLEANGIVGNFEGSKARDVLVKDEVSLEQILNNEA